VNTTGDEKRIPIEGTKKGIISNRLYEGVVVLGPQQMDLMPINEQLEEEHSA